MTHEATLLTMEQKQLLYLLTKITRIDKSVGWVKETPFQALLLHCIQKGIFSKYDYAPISCGFLGKGRKFVNISKESEDDLGDLRELGLIETIRLSSSKHSFITGYRPTINSKELLPNLTIHKQEEIDEIFNCPQCQSDNYSLSINVDKPDFKMHCYDCSYNELIPLLVSEDVSYATQPYFFKFLLSKNRNSEGSENE
jgi:hypothetical protein